MQRVATVPHVFGEGTSYPPCTPQSHRIESGNTRYRSTDYRAEMSILDPRDGVMCQSIDHASLCAPK